MESFNSEKSCSGDEYHCCKVLPDNVCLYPLDLSTYNKYQYKYLMDTTIIGSALVRFTPRVTSYIGENNGEL